MADSSIQAGHQELAASARVSDFAEITRTTPEKSLLEPLKKRGGRDNHGHIAMRRIGGGHKRQYRIIDFKRNKHGMPATVREIEYDPNRSARIALVEYADGEKRYILHPKGLDGRRHDRRRARARTCALGNALPLGEMPLGTDGAQRRAEDRQGRRRCAARPGMSAQVVAKEGEYVTLRMPSHRDAPGARQLPGDDRRRSATRSTSSMSRGKAGKTPLDGPRPKVRGEVMNPVDHPHGGRTRGGRNVVSPWGKKEGVKTRNKKKPSQRLIVRGRKRGKATQ